jgi:endonuclease-3
MKLLPSSTVREIFSRFAAANPEPRTELVAPNEFCLLIAIILSAQATDVGVNKATPALFAAADTPQKMLALGEDGITEYVKTIGLYRSKARNIHAAAQRIVEHYGGSVPRTREELVTLPGVGRKTANVWLNCVLGLPVIAVDTHVFRVANRLGLVHTRTPERTESALEMVIPKEFKRHAHHWLILHGRYICKARAPACARCPIADLCRWEGKMEA